MSERIHGTKATRLGLLPAQVESAVRLCRALCGHYSLPMAVPTTAPSGECGAVDVLASLLPAAALDEFRGVLGHFHLSKRKFDPGVHVLRSVHNAGGNATSLVASTT